MTQITIDLSVVSHRNNKMVLNFLDSLYTNGLSPKYKLHVIVTCNNPESDLHKILKKGFPNVEVIRNSEIKSFAFNHNQAIRNSKADYLIIANDDIIVLPHAVQKMIEFMQRPENYRIGVLCPKLLNPDETLQPCTYSFPTLFKVLLWVSELRRLIPFNRLTFKLASFFRLDHGKSRFWDHNHTCEVDTFRGAFVLMRGKTVRTVGLMHGELPGGCDEIEWHFRIRMAGWKVVFFHEPEIIHLGSQSFGNDNYYRVKILTGYLYFFRQHRSKSTYALLVLLSLFILLIRSVVALLFFNKSKIDLRMAEIREVWPF